MYQDGRLTIENIRKLQELGICLEGKFQKDFNEIIRKIEIQTKCLMEEEVKEYLVGNYQEKLLKVQSILNENVEYKRAKIT